MTEERRTPEQDEAPAYAAPTLTVHGRMAVLTAQGTKPGRENHGNAKGRNQ